MQQTESWHSQTSHPPVVGQCADAKAGIFSIVDFWQCCSEINGVLNIRSLADGAFVLRDVSGEVTRLYREKLIVTFQNEPSFRVASLLAAIDVAAVPLYGPLSHVNYVTWNSIEDCVNAFAQPAANARLSTLKSACLTNPGLFEKVRTCSIDVASKAPSNFSIHVNSL